MKLRIITSPTYTDSQGQTWDINCDKYNPVVQQYMEALVKITKEAKEVFRYPMAYHFWIRLNEGRKITEFMDNLKKRYARNNNINIIYLRVKEFDKNQNEHHHVFLYLDQAKTRPSSLGTVLRDLQGKGKLLFNYELCTWESDITDEERYRADVYGEKVKKVYHLPLRTEQDVANTINKGSYLAKTYTKRIGAGQVNISTSRPNKNKF